jgi:hypothetical protein
MSETSSGPPQEFPPSAIRATTEILPKTWTKTVTSKAIASRIRQRERIVTFFLWLYVGLSTATIIIILLQGFKFCHFSLEPSFMNWLGAATVGEVGGLLAMIIGYFFRDDHERHE